MRFVRWPGGIGRSELLEFSVHRTGRKYRPGREKLFRGPITFLLMPFDRLAGKIVIQSRWQFLVSLAHDPEHRGRGAASHQVDVTRPLLDLSPVSISVEI